MTDIAPAAPAGWYPEPRTGIQRYWDGSAWGRYAPPAAAPAPAPQFAAPVDTGYRHQVGFIAQAASGEQLLIQTEPPTAESNPLAWLPVWGGLCAGLLGFTLILLPITLIANIVGLIMAIVGLRRSRWLGGAGRNWAIVGIVINALLPSMIGIGAIIGAFQG